MKGVKDKTGKIFQSLGMSDNILTMIESRSKCDLLIFFGLCIFTLFTIFMLYFYIRPALYSAMASPFSSSAATLEDSSKTPGVEPMMLGEINNFESED